jgi:hypothetical protein
MFKRGEGRNRKAEEHKTSQLELNRKVSDLNTTISIIILKSQNIQIKLQKL